MQKHSSAAGNGVSDAVLDRMAEVGAEALEAVQSGAARATSSTESLVRKHPLISVGVAFGGGAALGILAYRLLSPKQSCC